jgi:hypothetical protein
VKQPYTRVADPGPWHGIPPSGMTKIRVAVAIGSPGQSLTIVVDALGVFQQLGVVVPTDSLLPRRLSPTWILSIAAVRREGEILRFWRMVERRDQGQSRRFLWTLIMEDAVFPARKILSDQAFYIFSIIADANSLVLTFVAPCI